MCGRYGYFTDSGDAEVMKIIRDVEDKIKTGEIFPTNLAPILLPDAGSLKTEVMRWGFPPFKQGGKTMINARSETAAQRPMFAASLRERRCVVPSTGFYEWGKSGAIEENGQLSFNAPKRPVKIKYMFNLPGEKLLYMAGIYRKYKDFDYYTILTTEANNSIKDIHSRMPVVLKAGELDIWLNSPDYLSLFQRGEIELIKKAV